MNTENLVSKTVLCLLVGALMAANAFAALPTRTVKIDCTAKKPKSINEEINKSADEILIIEITGLCTQDIQIERRNNVTLRGTDPLSDGIQAVSVDANEAPNFGRVLDISYSKNISIENLTITGGVRIGVSITDSGGVFLSNSRVVGNGFQGLFSVRSHVIANDTEFTGNGFIGAQLGGSTPSRLICDRCTFAANPAPTQGIGIILRAGSAALIRDNSTLAGGTGLFAIESSHVNLTDSTVTGAGSSINVNSHAGVIMRRGSLDGQFTLQTKASLELYGVTQINAIENVMEGHTYLKSMPNSPGGTRTTLNSVRLTVFSKAWLTETDVDALQCGDESNVFCEGGTTITGMSDCPLCLSP